MEEKAPGRDAEGGKHKDGQRQAKCDKAWVDPWIGLKGRAIAGPHDYDQIPALVDRSKLRVKNFLADLDVRLTEVPFVAGEHYSIADITALVTVDFAAKAINVPLPDEHAALRRWYELVSKRASASA